MNQDQFLLKWNNHQNNLVEVFSFLRAQDAFVDVTLACDGKSFPAHKVVLSACSPYFQTLFQSNPCKHPIVFLKDVKSHDMEALIEFIYKGEVSVSQTELASLISTAENLKIKGLAEPESKPAEKHSNPCSKRLASPTRITQQQLQQQPMSNNSNSNTLHASPMYLQSTPSVKRKRVDSGHYQSYTAAAYLGGGNGPAPSNTIIREKEDPKGIIACSNGPAPNSIVVDMNSGPVAAAAHRLVESVVNSTNGAGGCSGSTPSQVVLVPVPGDDHIAGDLAYNTSSHHALATSDAVLYSVAGTAFYVGRVGSAPGDEAAVPAREVMYASGGEHYASSDEGGQIQTTASEQQHEVNMSIKLEPTSMTGDPWEPSSNSSNHSYDDATTTTTPPAPITSSCISSPHPPPSVPSAHPSPLHLQQNHLHTPSSSPSSATPLHVPGGSSLSSPPPPCSSSASNVVGSSSHLTITGLALQPEELTDAATPHSLHDSAAARAGGGGGNGGSGCDEARCLDMTSFASGDPTSSTSGGAENCSITATAVSNSTTASNCSNSSGSTTASANDGTILEVQGCFIKSEVGSITSGTMRRLLECEHCHKFFTSRFNLQRHQLIHTGAKPYECPLCQQRFNQSGHVKTHLRTRHPNHDQILQDSGQLGQEQRGDEHINSSALMQHEKDKKDLEDEQQQQHITVQHNDHVTTHTIQHSEHVAQIQRTTEHL